MTLASLTLTTTGSSIRNEPLFVAEVLQPTGLSRGAALRFSFQYTIKDG